MVFPANQSRLNVLSALLAIFLFYPSLIAAQANSITTVAAAPPNEVRALWVVRTTLTSPEKIRTMVEAAANNGFNTIIVQVRGRGDAYYRSRHEPRASELKDQPANFDPLAVTLSEAKRRGLKVHAWINTSLLANLDALPTDPNHVYNKHPEWLSVPRPIAAELYKMSPRDPQYRARIVEWSKANRAELEGVYTGPANEKVREHIYKIWMDVLKNYQVDGLHFDYVRLASPDFDYSRTSLDNFRKWLERSGIPKQSARLVAAESRGLLAVRKGGLPPLFQLSEAEHPVADHGEVSSNNVPMNSVPPRAEDYVRTQKSHPRQWVDGSSPAYNGAMTEFLNPTHGSGWMVQIPPRVWENRREKAGLEPSTHCYGWDSRRRSALAPGRLDLNYPPTAVDGISEFPHSLGSGWVSLPSGKLIDEPMKSVPPRGSGWVSLPSGKLNDVPMKSVPPRGRGWVSLPSGKLIDEPMKSVPPRGSGWVSLPSGKLTDEPMKSVPPRGSGWVSLPSRAPKPTGSTQSIKQNPLALAEAYPDKFADFQREQITTLVQRIYRAVKKQNPNVTVSAAVFANDENAYTRRFQDWRRWLSMGILDVVCPMAYTTDTEVFKKQIAIATTTAHTNGKKVWSGIGAYRLPVESTIEKINAARSLGSDGIILFSYDFTTTPSPLNPTADYLERVRPNAFAVIAPE